MSTIENEVNLRIKERGSVGALDNFCANLGYGITWDDMDNTPGWKGKTNTSMNRRDIAYKLDLLDTPYREINEGNIISDEWQFSEKFLFQTPRQFFAIIDAVITELNISNDELYELRRQGLESLYQKLTPVYVKLREMGYSDRDLSE